MENEKKTETNVSSEDMDAIISILDQYVQDGGSRLKFQFVEGEGRVVDRKYHHGRCDIGSPWAKGQAFDVLEPEE